MIKNYLLTCLLFFCAFISYGQTYNQITTLGELTDGNYLIVGDGTSNDGLMVNSTDGSVYIDYTAITNPGAAITTGYTANNVFNITVSGGNITIYNANEGYASWGRSGVTANDADFFNGTIADTERWTPTVSGGLWTLANVSNSTRILQWNNSAPRFVAYSSNQVKLKLYKEDAPTNTIVQFTSTTSTLDENGLFIDICVSITNASASTATTVDIALDGSSTATNGTDYDDGAGVPAAITFPYTLTFPIGSTTDECFTVYISNDDLLVEGNETVVLDLVSPAGGDSAALGSNDQHVLTIIDNEVSAIADVVITEIMYDSAGYDDEWIEICNVSGVPQVLNDYTIDYNGSTLFTFPSSGVIMLDGTCITVSLGSNGDGIYNNDCPFTPDYGIGASTFNNNNLINTSATISLVASDGTTDIDVVTYDDGDGANNTGESLHVVDTSLDNSVTNTNYWEVLNGGSPGVNSLISPCTPPGPEINVEGDTGNYPDIADGDVTPNTFDGTDFGSSFIGSPLSNPFRIENFAGTTDLIITSVTVLSGDTGDFSIITLPASPIAALGTSSFDIEFNPTAIGTRTAVIQIISNDTDENPYTFTVTGEGLCFATGITATPTSGPVDTIVTVTGTDLLTATATFNGLAATAYNISATLMTVIVPAGATTGNLEITDSNGCPGSTPFTVIDSEISGCEGSGGTIPTDLFISEITDATYGGLSYVELFNGTGAPINIDNYSIEVIANGDPTAATINIFDLENFTMPNGTTYVIAIGRQSPVTSTNACTSITGGSGELASSANAQFSSGGINKKTNEHDVIRLVNTGTTIDEFGVYEDSDWMDSTIITGDRGFNFRRSNTATVLPDPTFTLAELGNWTVIDWVGSGTASCSGNDYSHIGIFDFSTGTPPIVTLQPVDPVFACAFSASLTIAGTEGFTGPTPADTQDLAYQWFYNVPGTSTWTEILPANTDYSGQQTATLNIIDTATLNGYQYYCQLREDTVTCYEASNAVKLDVRVSIWDGTNWSVPPTIDRFALINGNYDTSVGGDEISFSACSLTVNSGFTLDIRDNTFIEIENDIVANGDIIVETDGAVVQINDLAAVTGSGVITVQKFTTVLTDAYNYTYWSSPVANETIENVFSTVQPTRRFTFNAANFVDTLTEVANTGTFTPGPDDIDDNGDDWEVASGTMLPGIGYAATPSTLGPAFPVAQQFPFVGPFNNGVFTPTIINNSAGVYNDWNFIGNPYPSAIDASVFFTVNTGITDNIYLWSQATPLNANASGNEGQNFSGADYAIINASGVNVAGGDGVIPNDFVPSGQGFFIEALSGTNITFNNSMRVTGNNDQFFRNENTGNSRNVLWLNLSSDNGVAKQIAVAHLDGATDSYDGSFYDVKENLSSGNAATIYSRILDGEDDQFVIQGKNTSSLDEYEVIHVGFKTIITVPTLYNISIAQFEGDFYTTNTIYLKDNLLNTYHNLKDSDYIFTSETGIFNDRFEIVFRTSTLSIKDNEIDANGITITELTNGNVEFKLNSNQNIITNVEIIDMLGRRVYNLRGNNATEVYNLSQLSKSAYIAKITLSNGQIISKKAIKQQ
ncbi:lamin tail domain-containing protein [Winogradskyella sp. Asnod2-B02-A]|uniref:lamin tail domain-containing protein n=1 Tax=Winogradskyella sp. Asnod2-B02-A TaxID=3160583 RepID=UPI00386E640E